MTQFLIDRLIKDHERTDDPGVRTAYGRLAGAVGIICNLLLFAGKLTVGLLSHSISVIADAFNALSDIASGVISLIGFAVAAKPPDEEHPFGHARFEYISGLAVAGVIVVVGVRFAESSVRKILHPEAVDVSLLMCAVLVVSMAIKLWLSLFYRTAGEAISSATLKASAKDSRNDILMTGVVLLSAAIERFSGLSVDGIAGLAVSVVIIIGGIQIARETISPLLGENADPALVHALAEKILAFDERILGLHDLMVHDYGPGQRFASVHLEIDAKEDVLAAHELIDTIERRVREEDHIQLLIHHDPVVTDDPEQNHLRRMIAKLLWQEDRRLSLHDFRIERHEEETIIRFDAVMPADIISRSDEIIRHIRQVLDREDTKYVLDVTVDTPSFNAFDASKGEE